MPTICISQVQKDEAVLPQDKQRYRLSRHRQAPTIITQTILKAEWR